MNNTYMRLFHLKSGNIILISITSVSGMVGEEINLFNAVFVSDPMSESSRTTKIGYDELKQFYKQIEGRSERIDYWMLMKEFIPEGIAQREADEEADAIGRVI